MPKIVITVQSDEVETCQTIIWHLRQHFEGQMKVTVKEGYPISKPRTAAQRRMAKEHDEQLKYEMAERENRIRYQFLYDYD